MNKDNAKDYLPLVQALADGKVIQVRHGDGWKDLANFDFTSPPIDYRIKPEPKEIWLALRHCGGYDSPSFYTSKDAAYRDGVNDSRLVKYREVIE